MPISITYWRDVLRKLTTTEMDNNFQNIVDAIADAGLSPTMPEGQIYIGDNTNTASLDILDTSIVPETTDRNYQTDNQKLFNDATSSIQTQFDNIVAPDPAFNLSVPTGVCEGGILSINADPTKFNISDGFGYIADLYTDTDPANATITKVTWSGLTAQTVTNLATSTVSFIYINTAGAIVQTTTEPTEETLRDYIYIGQLGHSNLTSISTAISQPSVAQSPMSQLRDLWGEIGFVNAGNEISANGANLSINKSNGFLTGLGINFENAIKTPNRKNYPAQTLATIRRRTQTGGSGTNTTLDVLNYDLSGTVTTITGTKAQNQRVFLLPSGNIVIQYGQTLYNSLTDAIQGIETETFVKLENVKTGQLIAIISVLSTCTSLQDTNRARIKNVGKFGEVNVGAGSASVSTLQQAYNNSVTPEILTDTTRGALSIKRGTTSDTDTVFDVQNGAGTETFTVDGNGLIKSAQATASTPAFFSTVKGIISATGALLGTWFQTLTADTNPVDADTIVVNDSTASFEAKKTTLLQLWTNYIKTKADSIYLLLSGGTLTGALNYPSFSTLASASTTNIGSVNNNYIEITGTTNITSFGTASAGVLKVLRFSGVLTIFNNGTSLILPNGIDVTTKANDIIEFISLGSGNWICTVVTQGSLGNYVDLTTAQTITGQKTFTRDTGNPTTGTATGTVITQLDCARIINAGKYIFYVSADSVSIGKNAGHGSGTLCTVMGSNAGNWSMSGQQNALYGYFAGNLLSSGSYNTVNGSQAGQSLTTGGYNVYSGFGAGYGAGGANSNNVYLGALSGDSKTESFRLRIHSATAFSSVPIIYGEFDNRVLRFDVNSLSIGSTNANASAQLELQSTTKGLGLNTITSRPTGRKFNLFGFDTNGVLEYSDTTGSSFKELAVYKFDELLQITDCNATFATANTGVYFPFVPKCDMNVLKIYYNLQSAGTDTVRVAIYSDASNTPTTLLGQSSEATTGATPLGQRSITIASTRLLAQTRYWIAIKNDNGASSFLSKNNVYSNNITREGFTSGAFVGSPAPSSAVNVIWLGIGI